MSSVYLEKLKQADRKDSSDLAQVSIERQCQNVEAPTAGTLRWPSVSREPGGRSVRPLHLSSRREGLLFPLPAPLAFPQEG